MKKMMASLAAIFSVVIIISFFMPWARASTSATRVVNGAAGALQGTSLGDKVMNYLGAATQAISGVGDINVNTVVRGCDIPALVRKQSSHVAISLALVYIRDANDLDTKVLLIYLVPFIALSCIALAFLGMKNILYVAIMGLVSAVISVAGFFKIMTTDMSSAVVQISIENGLWITLWAYLAIFAISVAWLIIGRKKPWAGKI